MSLDQEIKKRANWLFFFFLHFAIRGVDAVLSCLAAAVKCGGIEGAGQTPSRVLKIG